MAIGSGLGSQVGFSAESVYGTYVAPTKFIRARAVALDKAATRVQGEGIAAGQYAPLGAHHVETIQSGTGRLDFDVTATGLGLLWTTLMGGLTTPSQLGGTTAYQSTFTMGDPVGKSLTVQSGVPLRGGTVSAHTVTGAKVLSAEFSCDVSGLLQAVVNLDAKKFVTTEALATASYTTAKPFHGGQLTVKLGTYGTESTVTGVRSVSVSIGRPQDVADYTAGGAGLKNEPVLNAYAALSGSITADFLSVSTFQARAHDPSLQPSLVLEWVGALITGSYSDTFRITVPGVVFAPATQSVAGVDVLTNQWSWTWVYDGTNLPKIETISTDSAH